CQRHNTYPYGF
nr:immunoglobulin light chain junction region [Macaca mulatta]